MHVPKVTVSVGKRLKRSSGKGTVLPGIAGSAGIHSLKRKLDGASEKASLFLLDKVRGAIRARNKSGNCAGGASTVGCGRCENYSVKPERPPTALFSHLPFFPFMIVLG